MILIPENPLHLHPFTFHQHEGKPEVRIRIFVSEPDPGMLVGPGSSFLKNGRLLTWWISIIIFVTRNHENVYPVSLKTHCLEIVSLKKGNCRKEVLWRLSSHENLYLFFFDEYDRGPIPNLSCSPDPPTKSEFSLIFSINFI